MLRQRVLSALWFVPLSVSLILIGGVPYALGVGIMLLIAGWELDGVFRKAGYGTFRPVLYGGISALALIPLTIGQLPIFLTVTLLLVAAALGMMGGYGRGETAAVLHFGFTLVGVFYLGWLGGHLIWLRTFPNGELWTLIGVLAIGVGDAGAYFVGSAIGRHKLAPLLSPGKTWEGYLGGVVFATLTAFGLAILATLLGRAVSPPMAALIGMAGGIFSPLGDLAMSVVKRAAGVKHFSLILAGHGGVLDRIDSILFGVPICVYLLLLLG